jgi:hypothetical protein
MSNSSKQLNARDDEVVPDAVLVLHCPLERMLAKLGESLPAGDTMSRASVPEHTQASKQA